MPEQRDPYTLKAERGSVVKLAPHPKSCSNATDLLTLSAELRGQGRPLAADLFCGAGGISLGLQRAGFEVVVGVDTDADALATHAAYSPGLHLDWDLGDTDRVEELSQLLTDAGVSLIAGGPPCQPFSKAGRSLIRDLVRSGRRPSEDQRRDLWQSFLAVIERVGPDAVLMENVPDMALDRDMLILRTMVDELERLGYSVEAQIVDTSDYGVPQHRQRLILVALRDGAEFIWPHENWGDEAVRSNRLRDAINDLPDIEPGWRTVEANRGWVAYAGPRTPFQKQLRTDVPSEDAERVYDHVTRPVRDDDREAFELLTAEMKYSELPKALRRYRADIFDDKYKRLDYDKLSRTITAHMAKDGYWYIHPEHHRTLTVREAARVQTFPDHIRFSGPPTAAFRQIGNAVPPLLAEHLGRAILEARDPGRRPVCWRTRDVSARLAEWVSRRRKTTVPWVNPPSRWTVVQAEMLLHRAHSNDARHVWEVLRNFETPEQTVEASRVVQRLGKRLARADRAEAIIGVAKSLAKNPSEIDSYEGLAGAGVPAAVAELALRYAPSSNADPIVANTAALRVAARFHGRDVHRRNKRSDGRIALARLVGVDEADPLSDDCTGHLAHLAVLEIGAELCLPREKKCQICPLREWCAEGRRELEDAPPLPYETADS